VDYNETAGIGFDDPDSLGEGLCKQIDAQYRLFAKIREHLPDLVIENCASGGHRLGTLDARPHRDVIVFRWP
jgi:alpha-galactosidase